MSCREVGPTRGLGRFNFVGVPTTVSPSVMTTMATMTTMKEAGAEKDEEEEGGGDGGSGWAGCGGKEKENNKWDQAMCDAALIVAISEATEFILRKLKRYWIYILIFLFLFFFLFLLLLFFRF